LKTVIKNTFLTATINSFGAELCSLKNNENKEYIWEGNLDFWGKHSPILFPIVGTLKNNSYQQSTSGEYRRGDMTVILRKLDSLGRTI